MVARWLTVLVLILIPFVQSLSNVLSDHVVDTQYQYESMDEPSCSKPKHYTVSSCEYYKQEPGLYGIFMRQCCALAQKLEITIGRIQTAEPNELIPVILEESVFYIKLFLGIILMCAALFYSGFVIFGTIGFFIGKHS